MLKKSIVVASFLGFSIVSQAQSPTQIQQIGYLLEDALLYSKSYIVPATDAAVYQATSSWVHSAKRKKMWEVHAGLHFNVFKVPGKDREFTIQNSDFKFFHIENGATSAIVPTALGNDNQIFLVGDLDGQQVRLKTPEGINQEFITYPYLDASIGLPFGTELLTRFSSKTKLKHGDYQVYGFGLKHNLSQYFPKLEKKNIFLAVSSFYSKEEISFGFLDINSSFGNLGMNQLTNLVDTFHFQFSVSKQFKKVELIGSFICNSSMFNYTVSGEKGTIEDTIPIQDIVNRLLDTIEKRKNNYVGEIAANYNLGKFTILSSLAFGKFINGNMGVQYKIN